MRIEYQNTSLDIIMFGFIHQFLSPVIQVTLAAFALIIFWVEINTAENSVCVALIYMFLAYVFLWIFQLIFNIFYYLFSGKHFSVLINHIIEITDGSLYEETKYNRSHFYWNGIHTIVKRPGYICIYISPQLAHIIPKRIFKDKTEMDTFFAKCKGYIDLNKNKQG